MYEKDEKWMVINKITDERKLKGIWENHPSFKL